MPERSPIVIPKKPNVPPKHIGEYVCYWYGEKGIGKTSLAAEFPGALIFMFESFRRNLPIRQIPDPNTNEEPLDWSRFRQYIDLAVEDRQTKTIVVDTAGAAYEACFDFVCEKANCDHPNQVKDFGQTWRAIRNEYMSVITDLIDCKKGIIFIDHAADPREKFDMNGRKYEQIWPEAQRRCFDFLKTITDLAFYLGYREGTQRWAQLRGTQDIWASCGTPEKFLDPKTKKPLLAVPLGDSSKDAYRNLCKAYENKLAGGVLLEDYEGDYEDDE